MTPIATLGEWTIYVCPECLYMAFKTDNLAIHTGEFETIAALVKELRA